MFDFRFFEIYRSSEYMSLLLEGILISSSLTIISGGLGFIIAFILAASIYWKVKPLNYLSICWIDFIRNTPLIVQLFFVMAILGTRASSINYKFYRIFWRNIKVRI